jgi:5'-nucleotidase/UDP-sugar diphosphatase
MLKLLPLLLLAACGGASVRSQATPPDLIILQINDVYEANPVGGEGGLARVASLRTRLVAEAPVITLLAGDFVSPSAIGLAQVEGQTLAGKQMVAAFNALGLDYVTFGNHEFDIKEPQLLDRLQESKFTWISSNVRRGDGQPFPKTQDRVIHTVQTPAGPWSVGLFGVTLNSNPKDWVRYDANYTEVAKRAVAALEADGAQLIVALSHLDLDDDEALAEDVPRIDLVLGGHEHENVRIYRGRDFTPVLKADANARTVYVHRLRRTEGGFSLESDLVRIDAGLPEDPATAAVAKQYTDLAFDAFRKDGLAPERVVTTAWVDFDGREASVRNRATDLTDVLAQAMIQATPGAQVALYNGGSIRIDDVILKDSPITEYDVLRVLPFGGAVMHTRMTGELLLKVLAAGESNRGKGGFLQTAGLTGAPGAWLFGGAPIDPQATYVVAINDFLLTGKERNLDFLTPTTPGLSDVKPGPDLRRAFIDRLAKGQSGS